MKRILTLLLALALSAVWAQGAPVAPSAVPGNPLVGVWRTSIPNQGGPPIDGILTVSPDNRYREEMVIQGQLVGFWEGMLSLSPDGTVTQNETNKSPQLCFQGQCEANDGPTTTVSRIVAQTASSITLDYQDPESGQTLQIVWQRAGGVPQSPTAPGLTGPGPGAPGPTPPGATAPGPLTPPGAAPQNPLGGAAANPWAGTYSDGDVTVVMAGPGMDYLERGGTRYPLQLQGDNQRLQGSFTSNGSSFPVTLERTGNGLVLTSGGASFNLLPVMSGGPAQPANPLGN